MSYNTKCIPMTTRHFLDLSNKKAKQNFFLTYGTVIPSCNYSVILLNSIALLHWIINLSNYHTIASSTPLIPCCNMASFSYIQFKKLYFNLLQLKTKALKLIIRILFGFTHKARIKVYGIHSIHKLVRHHRYACPVLLGLRDSVHISTTTPGLFFTGGFPLLLLKLKHS